LSIDSRIIILNNEGKVYFPLGKIPGKNIDRIGTIQLKSENLSRY